jgi:membrane protein required for beta-lactamase induction
MWPDMKIVALTFEILGTSYSRVFSHWFDAMDLRRSLRHSALNNGPSVFVNL